MSIKFSLCYTSCRAHLIKQTVNLWKSRAKDPSQVEVIVAVDATDTAGIEVCEQMRKSNGDNDTFDFVIQGSEPFNCVKGWNLAAEYCRGDVLIAISDDFSPPGHWDSQLIGSLRPGWWSEECVVHVNDGYVKTICTLPIITRKRYDKFGYIYHPRYQSMFCDTELTERAYQDGVVIEAMHLLFEHEHPDCGKRSGDAFDAHHASKQRWNEGEAIFNERKKLGFPSDSELEQRNSFVAYFQVTKDDFCLLEVCLRLVSEGVKSFRFCIPSEYWSGKVVSQEEIAQVEDVHKRLVADGLNSKLKIFDVKSHRTGKGLLVDVEAGVRNDSLEWIRSDGFKHILVVDGDELWRTGTLTLIQRCINSVQPDSISCRCIPTIGLPGLPIEGAQDLVGVYIGNGKIFDSCRTPRGNKKALIDSHNVIHFTATRKTMDEIIKKHRESGHYDDPNYDFEGWISRVLPNVHPGMRNAHMYRPYQIWPLIRAWTDDELADIPESVKKYLSLAKLEPVKTAKQPKRRMIPFAESLSRPSNYRHV